MSTEPNRPNGPDFARGIDYHSLADGEMIAGHVGGDPVLLARRGDEFFALGAKCSHYGAPLEEGLLVGETVRCPWHHASFCLRTGEVRRAPALASLPCWRVERSGDAIYVRERLQPRVRSERPHRDDHPKQVVIVGGGAAGNQAAETLRQEGYSGRLTMLSADDHPPCDRPNLSKAYLAGMADDDSNLLHPAEFCEGLAIDLRLAARVTALDTITREVRLADGSIYPYDALLLATGAEPVRLDIPGADRPQVHYLRTLADGRRLAARAGRSRRVVVVGASFIGLEAAASLRTRGLEVHVVAPDTIPMERILGPEIGTHIRKLHEDHGVVFHQSILSSIAADNVVLETGENIASDLVVVGIGVRPALGLAEQAGLALDDGIVVDAYLRTSAPNVYAAGDIARWPDRLTGQHIRVEHWVVAGRQGQTAARNILGAGEAFDCVPFFWTEQYDFSLAYTGHANHWDRIETEGNLEARDFAASYWLGDRKLAVSVIHRDLQGLRGELEFERIMARRPSSAPHARPGRSEKHRVAAAGRSETAIVGREERGSA